GNPKWIDFLAPFSEGFAIDFYDLAQTAQQFSAALNQKYFTQNPDESMLWKSQPSDLITAIASLYFLNQDVDYDPQLCTYTLFRTPIFPKWKLAILPSTLTKID